MSKASNAVASLEDTLSQIKTAVAKSANNMQDGTTLTASTPAANDGDQSQPTGDLQREQIADVKDQQSLSHESTDGVADSPSFSTAADSTGSVDETKADAEAVKNDSDDEQHASPSKHPARTDNSKIAALLKTAMELEEGDMEYAEGEDGMESAEGEGEAAATDGAEAIEGEGEAIEGGVEPDAEELAQIEALLGGADPKLAAAIPTLPTDDDNMTKVASDGAVDAYMEKVASVFPSDVQEGYTFAERLAQGIQAESTKTASADDQVQRDAIVKLAMEDADNVAALMGGMGEEGQPEGAPEGMPEGIPAEAMAGIEDPMASAPMPAPEEEMPSEGGEGGAGEAEALLQALQAAGISPESLMKAASASGFDAARATAILSKTATVK